MTTRLQEKFLTKNFSHFKLEWAILNKKKLKWTVAGRCVKTAMAVVLCIQQLVLYAWYGLSGYFTIKESLPLYTCRIAIIFTILALLRDKKIYKTVGIYWGIVGAILALMLPTDLDPFSFPHFTSVSFFVGHITLLWAAMYLIIVDGYTINMPSLRSMVYFSNVYLFGIYIFNVCTASNYCYVVDPPFATEFFAGLMPPLVYTITAFGVFNLALVVVYMVATLVYKIMGMRKKVVSLAA